jgi:hypothetical protein
MLADILRRGFALANRRAGLILVDLLWKSIWIAGTMGALFVAASLVTSDLRAVEWEDTGVTAANGLIALKLLHEFWRTHRTEVFVMLGGLIALSILVWFILEAVFRRKVVSGGPSFGPTSGFHILLLSNATKSIALFLAGVVCVRVAMAGALIIAVVTFVGLAFLLTLIDTLIRADAVELLGTDLFRVAGLLGILMSFECMVAASALAILLAGFANMSSAVAAIAMLGAVLAAVLFLSILHSYLLLVRFSAIAIMRQNVVEV